MLLMSTSVIFLLTLSTFMLRRIPAIAERSSLDTQLPKRQIDRDSTQGGPPNTRADFFCKKCLQSVDIIRGMFTLYPTPLLGGLFHRH
jgi:hypothetical protein